METKQRNKTKLPKYGFVNGCTLNNEINMNEVRDFTKKLSDDKKEILENSFDEIKSLTKELTDLKLQNEEMEILIKDVMKEKDHIEDTHQVLSDSYETLLLQYTETRKLLHDSHDQNVQMSVILERMRENEACLVAETQKLRKHGSLQDSHNQPAVIRIDTMVNLEKEVKFWQREAEKLSQIIELNDKKLKLSSTKHSIPSKKRSKEIKRYNKVVNRSHSVENSQRKSKELEFEKLKIEKVQMKNLLNDLERQVAEIQNNVVKISDERQKYKDFYYCTKDKLERTENVKVDLERKMCDESNENSKLCRENQKLSKELDLHLEESSQLKEANQDLLAEISKIKINQEREVQILETKLSCLAKENHDIGVRSNNLKSSIISLECDFKDMEQELQKKCVQTKEYMEKIGLLEKEITETRLELNEKTEFIDKTNKKQSSMEENILKLRKNGEILTEKLDIKTKEINTCRSKEKENEDTIHKMKSSFSAHVVKLETHIQNAEQIISSKIKLITSLELKVANNEKQVKLKDEDILHLKKQLNSKDHELETINNKFNEINEEKKHLEEHVGNLSTDHKTVSREVIALNDIINELKKSDLLLKNETKSLKETLNRKEDHMQIIETKIEQHQKEIPLKTQEISRFKKIISQLENEIDQKESHIGSLLSILESKEEKLSSIQTNNEEKEKLVKEYVDQLNSIDDCVIQSTARNNALEKEIENQQNNIIRLTRQKEHLGQMLSARNICIGQLQAKLADKNEFRYLEKISIINDFPEYEHTKNDEETSYSPTRISRKTRCNDQRNDRNESLSHLNRKYHTQSHYSTTRPIADNYDDHALRHRTQSNDGRSIKIVNPV